MHNNTDYTVSKKTLLIDKLVSKGICLGGIGIIVAVLLIIFYLILKVLPLFEGAELSFEKKIATKVDNTAYLCIDEWNRKPTLITKESINIIDAKTGFKKKIPFKKEFQNQTLGFSPYQQTITATTKDNNFSLIKINYQKKFSEQEVEQKTQSSIDVTLEYSKKYPLGITGDIIHINYEASEFNKLVAAIIRQKNKYILRTISLKQETDLFGAPSSELTIGETKSIELDGKPIQLLVSEQANNIIITTKNGKVLSFKEENGSFLKQPQVIIPFEHHKISSVNFTYGSNSFICSSNQGEIKGYSFIRDKNNNHIFYNTKTDFSRLKKGASYFTTSSRNKTFIIGNENEASLMNLTTQNTHWQSKLSFKIKKSLISPKYNKIFFLDNKNTLHTYKLDDPHPESSFQTYFSKIWYESKNEPEYIWQSTGGSSQAEKKLSMIPLIYGTIKATMYTMLFSVPLALLAAIFTSQFASWKTKSIVKPIMEIMASLPSVVIGFIGAIWFAPLIQDKIPSLLSCFIFIPLVTLLFGFMWTRLPKKIQILCKEGNEYLFVIPIILIVGYLSWQFGYVLEKTIFLYQPQNNLTSIPDFTRWWTQVTGLSYEQKNGLVVGISMGFAVIPIIFTIAEDSLSNVPKSLTSASLALGASRWQTASRVILPSAMPGIFSAIMIGFGRAVGETMIVLCAAGGTAIMDGNLFNGMRTLSMNLAIELPEAPHDSTLFRSLYLGAVLLFFITFIINTIAEIIRNKIRKKYGSL